MSRRTKFLIAALFLVLLGIPLGYVCYSWRVPDPLRFRIVAHEFERDLDFGGSWNWYYIEVRNTSAIPVYLYTGILYRDSATARTQGQHLSLLQEADYPKPAELYGPVRVPAHGSWRGKAFLLRTEEGSPDLSAAHIVYYYDSHSRKATYELYHHLCELLPESMSETLHQGFNQSAQTAVESSFAKSIDTTPMQ